jgi:hypothetical protein
MLTPWMESGGLIDSDKARETALDIWSQTRRRALEFIGMSEIMEHRLLNVIELARKALVRS